jgi:opacity protein-like surface antigen
MKKIISTLLISFCLATASLAQIRIGPFLGYGERLNRWGIGAYTEIHFNEKISVSPQFIQYFPKNFDSNPRRSGWELNANVSYYVITGDVAYLYGLAGLSYTNIRTRTSTPASDVIDNDGNAGLNIGIGTMVKINDFLYPFAEGKYTVGTYSQASLMFGVKFQLGEGSIEDDF